jgi:hypothetical protein
MTARIIGACVALLLAAAPVAQARDPLTGGTTTLRLAKRVSGAVHISRASFRITGGTLESGHARGTIRHAGTLRVRVGSKQVTARSLVIRLGKRRTLSAKVHGARVTLLKLKGGKVSRAGFDTKISRVRARLSAVPGKALGVRAGLRLGTLSLRARPKSVALADTGATALALDPGAASTLQTLGIAAAPVAPSTALSFPVTGGRVNVKTFAGSITHAGGVALTNGATTVALTDFMIDVSAAPQLTALIGGTRVPIASLDRAALKPSVKGRDITVANVALKLTAPAAAAFNQAFGTTAFAEGLLLGTATITASAS